MTNLLSSNAEIKSEVQRNPASAAGCCGSVAENVAADVAAAPPAKSLSSNDVADVADEPAGCDGERENGVTLLDEIVAVIRRHIALGEGRAEAVALWTVHAHTLDAHQNNPRLHLRSPVLGSGKTTLASIVALLTHRRSQMVSHCTPAAFFRMVEAGNIKTILLDEADQFISADRRDALAILNSGHHRAGAAVMRCDGDNNEPKAFSTWAAVVMASIGDLPATLESRSIIIDIFRKPPGVHVKRVGPADRQRMRELANRLEIWAAGHLKALSEADPALPDCIYNRDRDNWRPLIAIADELGGHWPETAREIARSLNGKSEDPSEAVMLLADIRGIFPREGADRLSTQSLITALCADEERPWCEYDRGHWITSRQLAKLLQMFDIRSDTIRIGDKTPKGYKLAAFQDAFDRYLPPFSSDMVPAATCATISPINRLQPAPAATIAATAGATDLPHAVGLSQ